MSATYTMKRMQNNSADVIGELESAKEKCNSALTGITTQIANIEDAWEGLSAEAMLEALSAQKTRLQSVIARLDSLISQVRALSSSAATAWPSEESE